MADSDSGQTKTEEPTQRKLSQARDKGQVAFSADLTAGLGLLAVVFYLWMIGPQIVSQMEMSLQVELLNIGSHEWTTREIQTALIDLLTTGAAISVPVILIAMAIGLATSLMQTGFRPSMEPLRLNVEKLSPVKGFGRLFSMKSGVKGLMAIVKVTVLCVAMWWFLSGQTGVIARLAGASMRETVMTCIDLSAKIAIIGAAFLVLIGVVDFLFQKWQFIKDMRMSRQELIDEQKESEGDPHLKARMRKLAREMSLRKGVQSVPEATVVVRNPTHFAVALKYDRDTMVAPVVVAKGQDILALKIIEIAELNKVPVYENKPLARTLYASVEIDQEIPAELFAAVAELLSYVYGLRRAG